MATAIRGQRSTIRERGSIRLNDKWTLKDVAFVPNASSNIISEGRLCDAGFGIYKDSDILRVTVKNTNRTVLAGIRLNRLWVFPTGGTSSIYKKPINTLISNNAIQRKPSASSSSSSSSSTKTNAAAATTATNPQRGAASKKPSQE
jgi:hypothetical protein